MEKIHLRLAFNWTCPECGRDHFEMPLSPDMGDKEIEAMKWEHGIEPRSAGEFLSVPGEVFCKHCSVLFEVDVPEEI
jgi:hypothetical protein